MGRGWGRSSLSRTSINVEMGYIAEPQDVDPRPPQGVRPNLRRVCRAFGGLGPSNNKQPRALPGVARSASSPLLTGPWHVSDH